MHNKNLRKTRKKYNEKLQKATKNSSLEKEKIIDKNNAEDKAQQAFDNKKAMVIFRLLSIILNNESCQYDFG